ncbi:MAG: phosphoenolpyruvate carboxylase, partial [Nocardioides sp.]
MAEETRTPETADLIEADRREPRVSAFAGGVSSDEQHASLRASVRQLGRLLGEAISRHQGPETLALVEQVRELSRDPDDGDLHALLSEQDDATAVTLARAFTAYFQLVNVTEQLHRWQEVTEDGEGPLAATTGRIREALDEGSLSPELLTEVLGRVEYRPVFTAHPTESTRRTVLRLLRKVAATIAAAEDPRRRPGDDARTERRLAELVDLLWQTDELRIAKPQPTDEARTALYYLAQIAQHVIPGLMEELQHQLGTV